MRLGLRAALALATAVLGATIAVIQPSGPIAPGWFTPILAFEFARTAADVAFLAGPEAAELRAAMDLGHKVDAVFPFAYAGVLALTAWGLKSRPIARVGVGAALVAAPLDLWENSALVAITAALEAGQSVDAGLATLLVATSAKWTAIGVAAGALALGAERRWLRVLSGLVAVVMPVAVVTANPVVCEGMAGLVLLWFGGLIGLSGWELWRSRREGDSPGDPLR